MKNVQPENKMRNEAGLLVNKESRNVDGLGNTFRRLNFYCIEWSNTGGLGRYAFFQIKIPFIQQLKLVSRYFRRENTKLMSVRSQRMLCSKEIAYF